MIKIALLCIFSVCTLLTTYHIQNKYKKSVMIQNCFSLPILKHIIILINNAYV